MQDGPITTAAELLATAVADLRAAPAAEKIAALVDCERVARQVEHLRISLLAALERDGAFADRGYGRAGVAVADLLGCDTTRANRWVKVAGKLTDRISLNGEVCQPQLPTTAAAFAAGEISLRHAEVIATAMGTRAAGRLAPHLWAQVERLLGEQAALYQPHELASVARDVINRYDQDGPKPDDRDPQQVNEVHLIPDPSSGGGKVRGELDAKTYDELATVLGARSKPQPDDDRTLPQRQAAALGELCRHALGFDETIPSCGGERPHLNVLIPLSDLETRARQGLLDFGGALSPAQLRAMACDARAVPVVLGGNSQPLDIGRAMRTVPPHLRRAVVARDRGCAWPGCDRPPSWSEVHHIREWWAHHGETEINNLVMLCTFHHHLLHRDSQWVVRIRDGLPEFIPPPWIDVNQILRRKPPPTLVT